MDVTKPPLQPDALDIALEEKGGGEGKKKCIKGEKTRQREEKFNEKGGNIQRAAA